MKIHLITGSTGFVGKYLVNAILEKGECVWIIVRALNNVSAQKRTEEIFHDHIIKRPNLFRIIEGDIMVENLGINDSVVDELKKHEIIFWHLAANLSFATENRADVQKTNYIGTVNTVKFANKVAKKFMHMSTVYVCGDSTSFTENELDKGQKLRNYYEKSKLEAEKYANNNCKLPFIIFRPSVIIGDAYRGKAEGCTFGYYRYAFMFYFLKKQIVKAMRGNGIATFFLKAFGTKYNENEALLQTPWLIIPYPRNGHVNMVTVDYVIESMIGLYERNLYGITVHLTHHNPPAFNFLLHSVLYDLNFRRMKLIPVPVWMFRIIVNAFYFFAVPIRKYVTSVIWYVPYFTETCRFDRSNIEQYGKNPTEISRELIARINAYARENILEHIEI